MSDHQQERRQPDEDLVAYLEQGDSSFIYFKPQDIVDIHACVPGVTGLSSWYWIIELLDNHVPEYRFALISAFRPGTMWGEPVEEWKYALGLTKFAGSAEKAVLLFDQWHEQHNRYHGPERPIQQLLRGQIHGVQPFGSAFLLSHDDIKRMETTPYEGYTNQATWNLALWLSNDYAAYQRWSKHGHEISERTLKEAVTREILEHVYFMGERELPTFAQGVLTDWFTNGVRWIDWRTVNDTLHEKQEVSQEEGMGHFLKHAVMLLKQVRWQKIVHGSEYEFEQDTLLQNAVEEHIQQWIAEGDEQQRQHLVAHELAMSLLAYYLAAVNWQEVHKSML